MCKVFNFIYKEFGTLTRQTGWIVAVCLVAVGFLCTPSYVRTAHANPGDPMYVNCSVVPASNGRWDVTVNWAFDPYITLPPGTLTPYALAVIGRDGTFDSVWMGAVAATGPMTYNLTSGMGGRFEVQIANFEPIELVNECSPPPPPPPTVSLTASPIAGSYPTLVTLEWTVTNSPTSCTAGGDWYGGKSVLGGSEVIGYPSVGLHDYTITCSNAGGTANASASTDISMPPWPTVILSTSPNQVAYNAATTLNWSSDNTSE